MSLVNVAPRLLGAAALLLATGACSGGDDSDEGLGQGSPPIPGDTTVVTTVEPAQLNDAHVVSMLVASNQAEIEPSRLAVGRAANPEVQAFAQRMVQEHGMLLDSLLALAQATGIEPVPSREGEIMESQTRATVQSLQSVSGAAFDSAYVAAMVDSHEIAVNLVDEQLLPAADEPRLRQALENVVRPAVAAHLEEIRQIRERIQAP